MPEQKTYLQRITEFSKAVHDQDAYERLHFDDAKDFCEFLLSALNDLPDFVTSYAKLGSAQAACVKDHVTGQEYRDFMEPRHRDCELARDYARTSIMKLNRFFADMGMEPFADIDVNDNSKVAMVCNQVMLEHIGKLDEYEAQLQGDKARFHSGTDYLEKAAVEAKANPKAAPFRPVKIGQWRREFTSERVRVIFRDMGDHWDINDVYVDLCPVRILPDIAYHAFMSNGKLRITAGIERPVEHMHPADIDKVIQILQVSKQDLADIKALVKEQLPHIPLHED